MGERNTPSSVRGQMTCLGFPGAATMPSDVDDPERWRTLLAKISLIWRRRARCSASQRDMSVLLDGQMYARKIKNIQNNAADGALVAGPGGNSTMSQLFTVHEDAIQTPRCSALAPLCSGSAAHCRSATGCHRQVNHA
jgi:hypothetical protein